MWEDWLAYALKGVPESERTALLLVAQQGMAPAEAAEIMNITPNHLRVLLHKARNRLRELREETL
jgi:DNA-directed RNA polymerase specialized sigma24 family protein